MVHDALVSALLTHHFENHRPEKLIPLAALVDGFGGRADAGQDELIFQRESTLDILDGVHEQRAATSSLNPPVLSQAVTAILKKTLKNPHLRPLRIYAAQNRVMLFQRSSITSGMSEKTLLTIAETADFLNCSSGFVRKRIALTESNNPGGWPRETFVNLQPSGAKSLYRIKKEALQTYLNSTSNSSKVEDSNEEAVSVPAEF